MQQRFKAKQRHKSCVVSHGVFFLRNQAPETFMPSCQIKEHPWKSVCVQYPQTIIRLAFRYLFSNGVGETEVCQRESVFLQCSFLNVSSLLRPRRKNLSYFCSSKPA